MAEETDRRVFVGGLAYKATEDDLREKFDKFGPIEEGALRQYFHFFVCYSSRHLDHYYMLKFYLNFASIDYSQQFFSSLFIINLVT